jgi:hypothetical protein
MPCESGDGLVLSPFFFGEEARVTGWREVMFSAHRHIIELQQKKMPMLYSSG